MSKFIIDEIRMFCELLKLRDQKRKWCIIYSQILKKNLIIRRITFFLLLSDLFWLLKLCLETVHFCEVSSNHYLPTLCCFCLTHSIQNLSYKIWLKYYHKLVLFLKTALILSSYYIIFQSFAFKFNIASNGFYHLTFKFTAFVYIRFWYKLYILKVLQRLTKIINILRFRFLEI